MATRKKLTSEEARAAALARARRYLKDSGLDPSLQAMAFACRFLEGYANNGTMLRYALALGTYFAWCAQRGLDPYLAKRSDANIYDAWLTGTNLAPQTVKTNLAVARSFCRSAFEDGEMHRNPFAHIRLSADPQQETPALTPSSINRVLDAISDTEAISSGDQRDWALIFTASRVGPRRKELHLFTWGDFTKTERGGRARFDRKGGKADTIDLPPDVTSVLSEWRTALEGAIERPVRPDEAVFPSVGVGQHELHQAKRGRLEPMGLQRITNMCAERFADVGLEGPRMATHVLRASAATIAFESGASIDEIMVMLGHKQASTTWTYIKRLNRPSPATKWALEIRGFPGVEKPLTDLDRLPGGDGAERPADTVRTQLGRSIRAILRRSGQVSSRDAA
jgi:integrase/recombinase XerD